MNYPRWFRALAYLNRLPEVIRCALVFNAPAAMIARYLHVGSEEYPYEQTTRRGLRMTMQSYHDVVTAWVIFCRSEYPMPPSVRTILDIGANYGAFSLWASQEVPTSSIVAIEPFPDCFARLREHVQTNDLANRLTVWNVGLGQHSEARYIGGQVGEDSGLPSQSRAFVGNTVQQLDAVEVAVLSMDDLVAKACAAMHCEEIDFVKLDVEGVEHAAITADAGNALRRIRNLSLEYHPNGSKATLFEIIMSAGLRCTSDVSEHENSGVACFTREPAEFPRTGALAAAAR